jgi:hypothetical protein
MRRWLCVIALLAGCPDRTIGKVDTDESGQVQKDIPTSADLDLLFVIDNSNSTQDKQTVFSSNFANFVMALDHFPVIGRPNLHIGVVSTTVDQGNDAKALSGNCPHPNTTEDGRLQIALHGMNCTAPTGRFLSDIELPNHTRQVNYSGMLSDELACIAQLGASGCGFEAPLEAMKRALDGSRPENANFLRPGAFLAVVILTDEDDCSVKDPAIFTQSGPQAGPGDFRCSRFAYDCDEPISPSTGGTYHNCHTKIGPTAFLQAPSEYVDFISTVKPPGRSVVAVIGGDPSTTISTGPLTIGATTQTLALQDSCHATINGNPAIGRPGIRLKDFVNGFGDLGLYRTVCQSDYSMVLADIGDLIFRNISPCLDGSLVTDDMDPNNPGTQLDCTVSDVQTSTGGTETESKIPVCKMTDPNTPMMGTTCWWTKQSPNCATSQTGLELELVRSMPPPPDSNVRVRCATKPKPM